MKNALFFVELNLVVIPTGRGLYSQLELRLSYAPRNTGRTTPTIRSGRATCATRNKRPENDSRQVLTLIPTNDHTRDVIMLGGSTNELVESLDDIREGERRPFPPRDLQQRQEA